MKKSTSIYKKIRQLLNLPVDEKLLLVLAFGLCGLFRFTLLFIPFRYLSRFMAKKIHQPPVLSSVTVQNNCRKVARIVNIAANKTPWESKCLVRALAAKILLRIFGYPNELYLGVKKDENGNLIAHAWLNSCTYNISGGSSEINTGYAIVGKYFDD
ncbi:MAG: lasso peptide biosynthesis B2 protein [Bacillota bacterium]